MGGTNFEDQGRGKTMAEAYNSAVQQAQWEHGHGGYTGTIAEKSGFVELKIPGKDGATVYQWLQDYIEAKYRAFDEPLVRPNGTRPDGLPVNPPPAYAGHEQALERAWQVYDDKWGPAVGIHLKDDLYLFCGIASC